MVRVPEVDLEIAVNRKGPSRRSSIARGHGVVGDLLDRHQPLTAGIPEHAQHRADRPMERCGAGPPTTASIRRTPLSSGKSAATYGPV